MVLSMGICQINPSLFCFLSSSPKYYFMKLGKERSEERASKWLTTTADLVLTAKKKSHPPMGGRRERDRQPRGKYRALAGMTGVDTAARGGCGCTHASEATPQCPTVGILTYHPEQKYIPNFSKESQYSKLCL